MTEKGFLPEQLAKDNKKFQYELVCKGATAGLFGDSIVWLVMAGVALECDKVTRGKLPLGIFRDVSAFELYMSDVGLLSAFAGIMPENYVAQFLKARGHELYYWAADSPPAEVDFVIRK